MKRFMRVGILTALLCACGPAFAQSVPADCAAMVKAIGAPRYKGDAPTHEVVCRLGYVLSHDDEHLTPDWVVERLSPNRFKGPGDRTKQGNPFAADPELPPGKRAELKDYTKSGFDRGHMAPAGDMKFSVKAMDESFYLSNKYEPSGWHWAKQRNLGRSRGFDERLGV